MFVFAIHIPNRNLHQAPALAHLNNDNKLDLAVFNGSDNTVTVMLGNGDGSFQSRTVYGVNTSDGYEIAAADVNNDSYSDLIVGGYNNSAINVLLNKGDGTFQGASVYGLGNRPVGLAVADFNNDGRKDIAVGNDGGSSVSIMLGNGTQPLSIDALTGLRMSSGRGNLFNGSQVDY